MSVIYEVFRQERKGQPFQHAGSVDAPDPASRRCTRASSTGAAASRTRSGSCRATPSTEVDEFADEFDLKYRRVDGYSIKARLKEARERAGTAVEI